MLKNKTRNKALNSYFPSLLWISVIPQAKRALNSIYCLWFLSANVYVCDFFCIRIVFVVLASISFVDCGASQSVSQPSQPALWGYAHAQTSLHMTCIHFTNGFPMPCCCFAAAYRRIKELFSNAEICVAFIITAYDDDV